MEVPLESQINEMLVGKPCCLTLTNLSLENRPQITFYLLCFSMSQPGVTGVLCTDNQGLALAGMLS